MKTLFSMAPTIVTPRLLLRPWRQADREAWAAMSADPRVMEFLRGPQARADALAVADRLAERLERDGYGWWVAECAERGSFAGVIALQEVPFEAAFTPALEVGWRLAAEYWGRGYATEGGRAALAFAFNELDRAEVVAITSRINLRSQRVMARLGMTYDAAGDFEHPRVPPGDPLRPHVLYRIRRSLAK